jgi:Zn-dependent protease
MNLRSVRVGRLSGIPIGVQPLWLVIVALITVSLGATYYPDQVPGISPEASYGLGLLSALLLFASILLHELGHAIVARRHGVEIEEIDLWLLGGVARMSSYPKTAVDELRFALAGPGVTLAIAIGFALVAVSLPASTPQAVTAVISYQLLVNLAIFAFNLLPAFPLDGGRVARALIWRHTGDLLRATTLAAAIGRGLGFGMVGLGVLTALAGGAGGIWLALIGVFVIVAARAEADGLRVRIALGGRKARNLVSFPAVCVPARTSVEDAVRDYFVPRRFSAFPVLEDGHLVGLLDRGSVERIPRSRRGFTTAGEACIKEPSLVIDGSTDVTDLLERPAFQRVGRAIVATGEGRFGIVSITDVNQALRASELAGETAAAGAPGRVRRG